jgi:hypothetical protein
MQKCLNRNPSPHKVPSTNTTCPILLSDPPWPIKLLTWYVKSFPYAEPLKAFGLRKWGPLVHLTGDLVPWSRIWSPWMGKGPFCFDGFWSVLKDRCDLESCVGLIASPFGYCFFYWGWGSSFLAVKALAVKMLCHWLACLLHWPIRELQFKVMMLRKGERCEPVDGEKLCHWLSHLFHWPIGELQFREMMQGKVERCEPVDGEKLSHWLSRLLHWPIREL